MKTIELLQAEIQMKEHAIRKLQNQVKDKEAQQNNIECDPDDYTDQFDEFLDESGDVNIAGYTYAPSYALKSVDPIAYCCGLNDYADSCFDKEETDEFQALQEEIEDLESEIEDLENEIEDLQSQIEEIEENQNNS